ncbi:hypothetical protein TNCV_3935011 [Trichonephila clavipes]|nr:hypothetical protein TNCV_3935011 [Trichonephila clavipes]
MHTCAQYCEVLSSVIAPTTFDVRKTPIHPRAGCNSRIKGGASPSQEPGKDRGSWLENIEENSCDLLPHKYHILDSKKITNSLKDFNVNVCAVLVVVTK